MTGRCIAVVAGLSLWATTVRAQAPSSFPAKGLVTNPSGRNLVVREAPPEVTAFSYSLGARVCSIGVGTEFDATAADTTVNQEIWYRISASADRLRNPIGCALAPVEGWIVGRLKTGWAVRMSADTAASFTAEADSLVASLPAGSGRVDETEAGYRIVLRYVLLTVGTLAGVVVLSIEKAKDLRPKAWYSALVAFEAIMLCVANVLFTGLLLDSFVSRDDTGFIGDLVAAFAGPVWGFAVLGFVLAVLALKFLSFSRG